MTPTIALLAVCIIAAILCVAVGVQQWRINQLNAENDRERARHKVTETQLKKATDERDHALTEAKNEYELRRQAERNLADANEAIMDWRWDANKYKAALSKYSRPRDPKTGRFYSAKKANERVKPQAWDDSQVDTSKSVFVPFDMSKTTTIDLNEGLAAFDTSKAFQVSIDMRGGNTIFDAAFANAMEQLQGLTVRKLCDEVKDNAGIGI